MNREMIRTRIKINQLLWKLDRIRSKEIREKLELIKEKNSKSSGLPRILAELQNLKSQYITWKKNWDTRWVVYHKDNVVTVKEPKGIHKGIHTFMNSLKLDNGVYELFTTSFVYIIYINNNGKLRKYAILL
jgi:hypothetical protein